MQQKACFDHISSHSLISAQFGTWVHHQRFLPRIELNTLIPFRVMDTNMEDASKGQDTSMVTTSSSVEPATIPTLDGWISTLMTCKHLAESDVQRLCDRVWARICSFVFLVQETVLAG